MIVTFIIDQTWLIIVLQNFGICGVDNVTSIKSKDAMILETVGGCREGSGEFREKILKGRQRDLRPTLVTISSDAEEPMEISMSPTVMQTAEEWFGSNELYELHEIIWSHCLVKTGLG